MSSVQLLYLIIGIVLVDYFFDQLLDFLNMKSAKSKLPKELKGIYPPEEYAKSQRYFKARSKFSFLTTAFSTTLTVLIIAFGLFGDLHIWLSAHFTSPMLHSLAFFGVLFLVSDIINIPFELYSTFVIEAKFGFNKTSLKTFWADKLKGYLLVVILGGGLGYVLLWLIFEWQEQFWIYALIVITTFSLFMSVFYTSLILPLFNKLTPLAEGELRDKINAYAERVKFPLDNIFVIDGSKRSSKANAFFSGMGKKKKIVLYDTLIEKQSDEELVAVLAHEVGHFKKKHIMVGMAISVVQMAVTLYILSLLIFNESLSMALGAEDLSVHLNLVAFALLYTPISKLTGILMNMISRKNEYEADAYASTTYNPAALQSALKKLSVDSLSNLTPHPAYVFVNYSHPTLLQRLKHMDQFKKLE
ncbi:STE24 endopeptidase [Roseivirga ehrenbergii]|uniref:Peptidase M48 n=1 Tax=Roseivirga ehrenbergii (strain DSM 102268 / JCM 13514 / KCTC 12282 / NCIMB 14502 / KMM 6017) TaxID=279360 RepID=A0A150XLH9_ROSEK|nr:M48 family metallopeptidase [Roseivirga ehrenbergii]KYG79580.1 peptidase M48 [Roseivirga ehrenbergii]TCL01055.1 STE24 endopeptidase [Roseivirga ehrenbergii]